ncbi:hypothetical protein DEGR_38770 (plasmid) [Deinococcus grandis]|nr:hypothetical protein DEGR_38770 [Deinococcus grandis]
MVGLDYHVVVLGHAYSVPHLHSRTRVDVRLTPQLIEIYRAGQRIAVHHRVSEEHGRTIRHTTLAEHMPTHHRQLAALNADALIQQAQAIGEQTAALVCAILVNSILNSKNARCWAFSGCTVNMARLEAACRRALFCRPTACRASVPS